MNRPTKLIEYLQTYNESMYGYELSKKDCKELVSYILMLENAIDIASKLIDDLSGDCPIEHGQLVFVKNCKNKCQPTNDYSSCWKECVLQESEIR